jgi:hypothetical protein
MSIRISAIFILVFSVLSIDVNAQKWKIKSYHAGHRVFEVNAIGNNPFTIAPLLKKPAAYESYISTIAYNSLYGHPGITPLRTFYINAEWQKDHPSLRFWKKYTLQAGLLLTTRIKTSAGALGNDTYGSSSIQKGK